MSQTSQNWLAGVLHSGRDQSHCSVCVLAWSLIGVLWASYKIDATQPHRSYFTKKKRLKSPPRMSSRKLRGGYRITKCIGQPFKRWWLERAPSCRRRRPAPAGRRTGHPWPGRNSRAVVPWRPKSSLATVKPIKSIFSVAAPIFFQQISFPYQIDIVANDVVRATLKVKA